MLPKDLEYAFSRHNQTKDLAGFVEAHNQLTLRTETAQRTAAPGAYGDPHRLKVNALTYRQVLLHRSILLFEGASEAAVHENLYSMVLSVRGNFETTASLGYLCRRLQSLKKGDLDSATVDENLCAQLLGIREDRIEGAPEPINILSAFEHADKAINISVLSGSTQQYDILKDCYEYLCEFCHPNFHSNSVAIDLNKAVPEFRFRHGQPMRDREFDLIRYLLLSAPLFVDLYDQIPDLLPSSKQPPP